MKKLLFLLFILLVSFKPKPILKDDKINVLFIGNSLTYYHDMPKMLQSMLNETDSNFNIEQSTFPGMTLDSHMESIITKNSGDTTHSRKKEIGEISLTEKILASKKWDIIVLQEGGGFQYFPEVVKNVISPTITKIKKLVSNKECKYIMFNLWPVKGKYPREQKCVPKYYFYSDVVIYGDDSKNERTCSQEIVNLEQDIKVINESYNSIKKENNFSISNHTNLHYLVKTKYPEIELYDDDYHPSESGSFLNACVFYKLFTNRNPSNLAFVGKLEPKTAEILKYISK